LTILSDPQTITVSAVAQAMPKLSQADMSSSYAKDDNTFGLTIRHTTLRKDKKQRIKHLVVFSKRAVVPDPLTAVNDFETLSVSVQIDRPEAGFSAADVQALVTGFQSWLTSTIVGKLYGRES